MSKNLIQYEAEAYSYLVSKSPGFFSDITGRTYDFMGQVSDCFPEQGIDGGAFHASSLIYMRLMQDLRCVDLTACRAYPTASGTIAASIWELSFEIKYLHLFPENSERWFSHDAINKTDKRYDERLIRVMEHLFPDEIERKNAADGEWKVYSYLSAFKHGNSRVQRKLANIKLMDGFELSPLPDKSGFSLDSLVRIIYHSCQYCLNGARFIATDHLCQKDKDRLRPILGKIAADLENYWNEYNLTLV